MNHDDDNGISVTVAAEKKKPSMEVVLALQPDCLSGRGECIHF